MAILRHDYKRGVKSIFFKLFLFLEQFDPNPVTDEGKARRAILEAKARGEIVDEADQNTILASFLPW